MIHNLALEVYEVVFKRELELLQNFIQAGGDKFERKSSVALFFSGLFNFYQFAAFEVKNNKQNLNDFQKIVPAIPYLLIQDYDLQ